MVFYADVPLKIHTLTHLKVKTVKQKINYW